MKILDVAGRRIEGRIELRRVLALTEDGGALLLWLVGEKGVGLHRVSLLDGLLSRAAGEHTHWRICWIDVLGDTDALGEGGLAHMGRVLHEGRICEAEHTVLGLGDATCGMDALAKGAVHVESGEQWSLS